MLTDKTRELLKVAEAVDAAPEERFDIRTWFSRSSVCGTTACAIGHFCLQNPNDELQLEERCGVFGLVLRKENCLEVLGVQAIMERFDISCGVVHYLFTGAHYLPPKAKARFNKGGGFEKDQEFRGV